MDKGASLVSSVPKNLGTNEAEAERSSPAAARASGSPPGRAARLLWFRTFSKKETPPQL